MAFLEKLKSTFSVGKTLYVPDCTTKFKTPKIYQNYKRLLKESKIPFIELNEHICSGDIAIDTGYTEVFNTLRRKNLNLFQEHSIIKIITNCPQAYKTFLEFYPIEVIHTSTIFSLPEQLPKQHIHTCHIDEESCGAYLLDHQPGIAEQCAKLCIPSTAETIITASPRCYLHLREVFPNLIVKEASQV